MAKPGPKPKGGHEPRAQLTLRLPASQAATYKSAAARLGLPVGDYIAARMAQADGLPLPEYITDQLEPGCDLSPLQSPLVPLESASTQSRQIGGRSAAA